MDDIIKTHTHSYLKQNTSSTCTHGPVYRKLEVGLCLYIDLRYVLGTLA